MFKIMELKSFVFIILITLCFSVLGVHNEANIGQHVMAKRDSDWDGIEAPDNLNNDENNALSSPFDSDNETTELHDFKLPSEVSPNDNAKLQNDSKTTKKYTTTTGKVPLTSTSEPKSQSMPTLSPRRMKLRFPGNDSGVTVFKNTTNKPSIGLVNRTSRPPGLTHYPPATINPHHAKASNGLHHPPGTHDSFTKHRVNLTLPRTVTTKAPKALKESDFDDFDAPKKTNSKSQSDSTMGKFTGAIKDFFGALAKKISRFFNKK